MAIVKEGIILENDNTLSFGDYIRADKLKVEDFKVNDDTYKVRTHKEVTRHFKRRHTCTWNSSRCNCS